MMAACRQGGGRQKGNVQEDCPIGYCYGTHSQEF
jgi:hypothetical protein